MHTVETILGKRGIKADVIKQYGVTCEQTEDGQLQIAFPLADVNGSVYGKHYRAVDTTTGSLTRDFFYRKGTKLKLPLFGWQLVKKQQTLVICEGETDALILSSRLVGRSDVCILGLVGTANAERLAAHLLSYAGSKRVVLAFDNDSAGNLATTKVVEYLDRHESSVKLFKLEIPSEFKDVGDWLASDSDTDVYQAIQEASHVDVVGLLGVDQIAETFSDYISKLRETALVELQFSPTLSEALKLIPGKLVGIAGNAGEGKSTLVEHFSMEALQQGFNVLFASREMSPAEVALKLLRMVRNQPLDDPRFLRALSVDELADVKVSLKKFAKRLKTTDGFGHLTIEDIDSMLHKSVAHGFKPDFLIVDNLFAISKNLEANSIIDLCYRLKEIAMSHQVCLFLLTHIRKPPSQGKRTIYRPTMSDCYGSQGLQAAADSILAVASDKQRCETYVETVKHERLGGKYADVTLAYRDYCLSEIDDASSTSYDNDEDYEEEDLY
jgi:hypothetical protein